MALSVGLQLQNHPPKLPGTSRDLPGTSRDLRQQPESLSTPCSCSCRCRSATCNICTRKPTSCLKHVLVDKPIQPLPFQEQNREAQHLVSNRQSSSRLLHLLLTQPQPQPQQEQNQEALQQPMSSRLASSAVALNSSDFNMANGEVRWLTVERYHWYRI